MRQYVITVTQFVLIYFVAITILMCIASAFVNKMTPKNSKIKYNT